MENEIWKLGSFYVFKSTQLQTAYLASKTACDGLYDIIYIKLSPTNIPQPCPFSMDTKNVSKESKSIPVSIRGCFCIARE